MDSRLMGRIAVLTIFGLLCAPHVTWAKGPYSDNELRRAEKSDESRIRELREQEITQLRIALGRRSPQNRKADLYLRLAEIYLEAYRMTYLLEGRVHDHKLEKGEEDKTIDHSHSRPNLSKAVQACNEIVKFRIPYSKMDQVHYFLGYNYGELGDRKRSMQHYQELVRRYPNSAFAPEAYRELGDRFFADQEFRKAIDYYQLAAKRTPEERAARVYHKLAWSYYRTRQYERAVETMKLAVEIAQNQGEKFLSIKEEALRDMAVFMTETGKVEEALVYFQKVAGDKNFYPKLLEQLGRQYERNVEPARAIVIYESLLKTHPDSDAALRVVAKLVDLDFRRNRYQEGLERLKKIKLPREAEGEAQIALQNLKAMIRRTATEHHEKARKKTEDSAYRIAEACYTSYLESFLSKQDPRGETPEIQMYLAEVKRELGKAKEASDLYRSVVESRDKRYAKEAGALWTASLAESIRKSTKNSAPGTGKAEQPSDVERQFISAADSLQDALGETQEGREAALRAAEVLAGYKKTQSEAIERIEKILSRSPKSNQAITAARLWLQILSDRLPALASNAEPSEDAIDDLNDAIKDIRKNKDLMNWDENQSKGKLKLVMAELDSRLKVFAIAENERERDYEAAAKGYEAFARETDQRDLAEKAYSNAMANFLKVADEEAVERVGGVWLKRFPKSPRAIESFRSAGTHYLIQGNFETSAKFFERLGVEANDADSLETAARIFEGAGNSEKAEALFSAYVKMKEASHRWPVLLSLGRSYARAGKDSQAANAYRECLSGPAVFAAECGARLADIHHSAHQLSEANALYRKVAGSGVKGETLSPFVGYARFRLASFQEEEARFDPLRLPDTQLKKAMNQRLAFFESLTRAYLSSVEAGGPWAIASLDRLARWSYRLADEIDAIPVPPGTDPKAVEQFRKSLAGVSGPLREKAIQIWKEAVEKSAAAELLSPALPEVLDRLADLKISGVHRAQGAAGKFRLAGIPADGGADGKSAIEKARGRLTKSALDGPAWSDYGNLLWGLGKPALARLAYDRAASLSPKNTAVLNNRAVILLLSADGENDALVAAEADDLLRQALVQDQFFLPAKMNRALLFNYYRLFSKSRPFWQYLQTKSSSADTWDGLGIALQASGSIAEAEKAFAKAKDAGASGSRFAALFHEAARSGDPKRCLSLLDDIDRGETAGFEKNAVERLEGACKAWKKE